MYEGGEMAMLILLPKAGRFEEFEDSLTAEHLNEILDGLEYRDVELGMPQFRYASDSIRLREILSDMGMPMAFTWPVADFSGMDETSDLFISDVLHKSFIPVDEAGTEAAAATSLCFDAGGLPPEELAAFTVNRPFIFLIRDIHTNTILFAGCIMNPLD